MTDTAAKAAIVTGAGSGIGRAVALQGGGFDVVIAGRRADALQRTAAEARSGRGRMLAVPCDVTDAAAVDALFNRAVRELGRLDVLFNNAGISGPPLQIDEISYEQWKGVVDVNLNGAFLCARAAVRIMKAQTPKGGRIINNGSISAYVPRPLSAPYTATKHAIAGLTKSISLDGRIHGIARSQIDIGNAETPLTEAMARGARQADGSVRPEPRFDVAHVGEAVLFMAGLPLRANVQFMTLMATQMPYIGRG